MCKFCVYHDDFTGVCVNANSEYVADFTSDEDSCDFLKERKKEDE